MFSLWTGSIFAVAAIGPSFGSLLVHYTNNLLSVFYLEVPATILYITVVLFAVPEPLSATARAAACEAYKNDIDGRPRTFFGMLGELGQFVRPLGIFIPRRTGRSVGWRRRDWNTTIVGIACAVAALNVVSNFSAASLQVGIHY
jgi:hypothetical protein